MSSSIYQPGVCNIGPAERRNRLQTGWIGLAITVVALVAIALFDVPVWARLLVGLPALLGAIGFLQYGLHFCVNFAMRGLYNLTGSFGETESVLDASMRKADQRKGLLIIGLSLLIAAGVMLVAIVLP